VKSAKIEKRFSSSELRAEESGGKTYLVGRAASYGVLSHDLGGFREMLQAGCFDGVLADRGLDCLHTIEHDRSRILGRTTSGTLKLKSDSKGLSYRTQIPNTSDGGDIAELCRRGDLNASSFAFTVDPDGEQWDDQATDDEGRRCILRTITRISSLHDISIVSSAAYPETAAGLSRSLPASMPLELRNRILRAADDDEEDGKCDCTCAFCRGGACDECTNESCDDPDCIDCPMQEDTRGNRGGAAGAKTKKVDGEELPQSAFIIHGDPDDTSTWKLPVRFSTLAKSESHVREAVQLFPTLKDVSDDEKERAWSELKAIAKKYKIDVDDEDDERAARAREVALACAEW